MSEHKDPIAEQIERDVTDYAQLFKTGEWFENIRKETGIYCATAQDKIATNRTVDAVLTLFNEWCAASLGKEVKADTFIQEFEKLRR